MKTLKFFLLLTTAAFSTFSVCAQSADEIIGKYANAVGGKDVIGKLNSIYVEATMQAMGNDGANTLTVLNGKGYKSESDFNGQKIINCVTDKSGWAVNPMAGSDAAAAMSDEQFKRYKDQLYIGTPLLYYPANGYKAELQGQEKVGNVNAYKIKLTSPDKVESTYYLDPSTWYVIKTVRHGNMQGQDIELTTTYSNYQKTDAGFVIPFSIEMDFGSQLQITTAVKKAEVNKPVDPKIFDKPAN
jgi:hypothetical protein